MGPICQPLCSIILINYFIFLLKMRLFAAAAMRGLLMQLYFII